MLKEISALPAGVDINGRLTFRNAFNVTDLTHVLSVPSKFLESPPYTPRPSSADPTSEWQQIDPELQMDGNDAKNKWQIKVFECSLLTVCGLAAINGTMCLSDLCHIAEVLVERKADVMAQDIQGTPAIYLLVRSASLVCFHLMPAEGPDSRCQIVHEDAGHRNSPSSV